VIEEGRRLIARGRADGGAPIPKSLVSLTVSTSERQSTLQEAPDELHAFDLMACRRLRGDAPFDVPAAAAVSFASGAEFHTAYERRAATRSLKASPRSTDDSGVPSSTAEEPRRLQHRAQDHLDAVGVARGRADVVEREVAIDVRRIDERRAVRARDEACTNVRAQVACRRSPRRASIFAASATTVGRTDEPARENPQVDLREAPPAWAELQGRRAEGRGERGMPPTRSRTVWGIGRPSKPHEVGPGSTVRLAREAQAARSGRRSAGARASARAGARPGA
jgi:hypothetical protein